jgi:hypothetical protein
MAQSVAQIKAKEIAQGITVTVQIKGLKWWEVRMKVAVWLVRLATWIAGMNYKEEA